MSAEASYESGERGRELFKKVASSRALPGFVRVRFAQTSFDRIDVDWSGGFVLDGELFDPGKPYALRIQSGPPVDCVTL